MHRTTSTGKRLEISSESIEDFLAFLRSSGRSAGTAEKYRRDLTALYDFLPAEEKYLNRQTLSRWQAAMAAEGYAVRTVNSRLSAVNSYLEYYGRRDLQQTNMEKPEASQTELTRAEYLRLLSAARSLQKERVYLWIKLLGSMGLSVQELPRLTVETVQEGHIRFESADVPIPPPLREELLAYAARECGPSGLLFTTKNRQPVKRTYIANSIQALSRDAQVDKEKASPRCLQKMYRSTRTAILERMMQLAEQSYDHLLEAEQLTIGWQA